MLAKTVRLFAAAAVAVSVWAAAPHAIAGTEVRREGACSASSDWKLKVKPDNGRLELEFEVDSNVVGQTWNVKLFQNGDRIFRGTRTTQAPSGSFEVRRITDDTAG